MRLGQYILSVCISQMLWLTLCMHVTRACDVQSGCYLCTLCAVNLSCNVVIHMGDVSCDYVMLSCCFVYII